MGYAGQVDPQKSRLTTSCSIMIQVDIERGIHVTMIEPRDVRRNWQQDYNTWWNRQKATPDDETPAKSSSESE
jgi:hypothetical protein